jgi:hypothetical protein
MQEKAMAAQNGALIAQPIPKYIQPLDKKQAPKNKAHYMQLFAPPLAPHSLHLAAQRGSRSCRVAAQISGIPKVEALKNCASCYHFLGVGTSIKMTSFVALRTHIMATCRDVIKIDVTNCLGIALVSE